MKAVAVTPRRKGSGRLIDVPEPPRGPVLVRPLLVGIDGTDIEIQEGLYGEAPAGEAYLIAGHESLGVVEAVEGAAGFSHGDLVVALVRRPDDCPACARGEPDMCVKGDYRERGIKGLHGFLCERYAEEPRYLLKLPAVLEEAGVLLEPLSIVEKAIRHAWAIQQRTKAWQPQRALVLGAGSIGLLAAMVLRLRGLKTLVYARDPSPLIRERLRTIGADYASMRGQGGVLHLGELPGRFGPFDVLLEATGAAPVAVGAMRIIGRDGVLALLSVTGGTGTMEICAACLNMDLVLGNRAVFGSVNANRLDFEAGARDMSEAERRWPGWLSGLITRRVPLERFEEALTKRKDDIKVVVEVSEAA